jgi:hypothetical protein
MTTFEQFQSSKKNVTSDYGCELIGMGRECVDAPFMLVYEGGVYIEDYGPDHDKQHRYYLIIERSDWFTDDLGSLERELYEYAIGEELLTA